MNFKDAVNEQKSKSVNWNDQNVQTGFDPTGLTGDYGGDVLPSKKRKKKVTHADDDTMKEGLAMTSSDVEGLPISFEAYAADKKKRKKKGGLVRRKVGLVSTKMTESSKSGSFSNKSRMQSTYGKGQFIEKDTKFGGKWYAEQELRDLLSAKLREKKIKTISADIEDLINTAKKNNIKL